MAVKNKKAAKEVTLQQVAEELNDVMQYGVDPETGEIDESEKIDVELKDKALKAAILEEANADLRASDEEDFSPEVWQWFLDNGVVPAEGDEDGEDSGEDDEPEDKPAKKTSKSSKKAEPEDDGEDEEDEAPKAKKGGSKKEDKPAKKPAAKKEKGTSFEQIAIDIVEGGGGKKELLKKFTALYEERGKDDPDFIAKRVEIYYNIACKELGVEPEAPKAKKEDKPAAKKDSKKPSKADPEDDDDGDDGEDEAPSKKPAKKNRK